MKLDTFVKKLEKAYEEEKAQEAEGLHNDLAAIISEQKPHIQTVLFVLEMLKFELLNEKHGELFKGVKVETAKED